MNKKIFGITCLLIILSANAFSQKPQTAELNPNDTDSKFAKVIDLYQNAISKNDLELAKAADKEFEKLFKSDKSAETAARRINIRFDFFLETTTEIDAKFCGKVDWVREAILKFQKDFKNYQGEHTKTFNEFLSDFGKLCVGRGLNPIGVYVADTYYGSRTEGGRSEAKICYLYINNDQTFIWNCGFKVDKMLSSEGRGTWSVEKENQVRFKYTYFHLWILREQRYHTFSRGDLKKDYDIITLFPRMAVISSTLSRTNENESNYTPLCEGKSTDSILCSGNNR